jgi:hypothetical protein
MSTVIFFLLMGVFAWIYFSKQSIPPTTDTEDFTPNYTARLMREDFELKIEAMRAAKEMLNEAMRHQQYKPKQPKMPWED